MKKKERKKDSLVSVPTREHSIPKFKKMTTLTHLEAVVRGRCKEQNTTIE